MADPDRNAQRRLSLERALLDAPWTQDFYEVLRRVESIHAQAPRLGEAQRPGDEPVRLGQRVELTFAPANLAGASLDRQGRLRIAVRFRGLFGPQAPMPIAITEFVRERERGFNDPTLARFADLFHHRMLLLFYRAWRQAQPAANRDRPRQDRFMTYVGALFGAAPAAMRDRDSVSDEARRFNAGHLSRGVRHGDALAGMLSAYFDCPVDVVSYAARWIRLPRSECSRLGIGGPSSTLGVGLVAGSRVLDAQHQIELRLGPLGLDAFTRFLPGATHLRQLRDWVRSYLTEEYWVRARLLLHADAVPPLVLGSGRRLGFTTWLGRRPVDAPAADEFSVAVSLPA
jgi:type VI secretion system protein ImpH